jgi:hypothetical protein
MLPPSGFLPGGRQRLGVAAAPIQADGTCPALYNRCRQAERLKVEFVRYHHQSHRPARTVKDLGGCICFAPPFICWAGRTSAPASSSRVRPQMRFGGGRQYPTQREGTQVEDKRESGTVPRRCILILMDEQPQYGSLSVSSK